MTKVCLMCGDTFPDTTTFCPKDGAALRAAVHGDDLIGEVFCDRYVVTDLLGEGGMGSVYVARDVRLPQQVAVKVLRERAMADASAVARFRQEAESASRINHDRVARVTDFGFMNDGRAYLIMEYVQGRTLKQVLTDNGPLSLPQAGQIARMIAEGLDAAHRLAIVHRDLKPDNVMIVDDEGGGVRVKLLDFGIAKVVHTDNSASKTATGFVIGTPQWMSPEQILGSTIDSRSDIYALGLLVHHMLTGRRAFDKGGSAEEEMMVRLSARPNRLAAAAPSVEWSDRLQAALDRALARDASERYATATQFAQALLGAIGEHPAIAPERRGDPRTESVATDSQMCSIDKPATETVPKPGVASPLSVATPAATNTQSIASHAGPAPVHRQSRGLLFGGVAAAAVILAVVAYTQLTSAPAGKLLQSEADSTTPTASSASPQPAFDPGVAVPTVGTAGDSAIDSATAAGSVATPTGAGISSAKPNTPTPPSASQSAAGATTGSIPARTNRDSSPPRARSTEEMQAHNELLRVMDAADADVGASDEESKRSKARETIRKLEALGPRLADATDRGNALLYAGMSHATLGENQKACASVKRAQSFAGQSQALRNNIDQWQELLSCPK